MKTTSLSSLLSFPFKDPAWFKKLFILALVILISGAIPVLPWIVLVGYMARLIRRMVVDKSEPSLPEWDDLGGIFTDGWRPFAASFTFMLPALAFFIAAWLLMVVPASFMPFSQMWSGGRNIHPGEFLILAGNFVGIGFFAVAMMVILVTTFLLPAAVVHSVVRQDYAAAFRFKEWWPIFTANLAGFILAYVVIFGMNFVFGVLIQILFITLILCCLVPFITIGFSSYFYVVYAALFAEAYRAGAEKVRLAEPEGGKLPAGSAVEALKPVVEPAVEPTPTLVQEPVSEPAPKPARKSARKPAKKAAADATLVQPPAQESDQISQSLPGEEENHG